MSRPRVAWVTAEDPHFTRSGGNIRQAHLLEALSRSADVHLLLYGTLDDARVRAACSTVTEVPAQPPTTPPSGRRRMRNIRRCLPGDVPHEVSEARAARRALGRALDGLDVDAVCVEHIGLAPLAPPRDRRAARWALSLHYLSSGTMLQWAATATTPAQRLVRTREAAHARRFESRLTSRFDTVFVVSDDDAAGLAGPSVVVPNGVAVEHYPSTAVPANADMVFVGRLDFLPNVDGIVWFADDVLPRIRSRRPDARLVVVGRDPTDEVRRLAQRPGVELHADVPDVRPYLERSRLSVVPLRLGTGTRLKALEALAAQRPVVGTSVGLAGLGLTREEAAIADDPVTFAAAVVELLGDDSKAARLADAGRDLVLARYAWSRIAPTFVDALVGHVPSQGERIIGRSHGCAQDLGVGVG